MAPHIKNISGTMESRHSFFLKIEKWCINVLSFYRFFRGKSSFFCYLTWSHCLLASHLAENSVERPYLCIPFLWELFLWWRHTAKLEFLWRPPRNLWSYFPHKNRESSTKIVRYCYRPTYSATDLVVLTTVDASDRDDLIMTGWEVKSWR